VRRATTGGETVYMGIAPLTGKILKNRLSVFERGENLLQNGKYITLCILDHSVVKNRTSKFFLAICYQLAFKY